MENKRFFVAKVSNSGKILPSDNKYLIVNTDEPYAEQVFDLIKHHELEKGTWDKEENFKDFVENL